MRFLRILVIGLTTAVLAGCSLTTAGMVDLAPISYSFHPSNGLESKLSVEPMTGTWANEALAAGVTSAITVNYSPDQGESVALMNAYFMPESVFDEAANPNEPPIYGIEVARADGNVLAVIGPQDAMFDSETPDGINIGLLYDALYDPENYMSK